MRKRKLFCTIRASSNPKRIGMRKPAKIISGLFYYDPNIAKEKELPAKE